MPSVLSAVPRVQLQGRTTRLGLRLAVFLGLVVGSYAVRQEMPPQKDHRVNTASQITLGESRTAGAAADRVTVSGDSAVTDTGGQAYATLEMGATASAPASPDDTGSQLWESGDEKSVGEPGITVERDQMQRIGETPTERLGNTGSLVGKVLHITNVGDRIIVSDDANRIIAVFDGSKGAGGDMDIVVEDDSIDQTPAQAPADYEDVYPGCPRTLPQDFDAQMAAERLQLYGCRYRRSCSAATDEQEASCTWYLTGKV